MKFAYVDACIWITLIEGLTAYRPLIREALHALTHDHWTLCTSDAVRLEVLISPIRRKDERLVAIYRALLETSRALKTPPSVFLDALSVGGSEGLKSMDAVHVAIATHHRCERFVTTDPHFKSLSLLTPVWVDLETA